MLMLLGQIRSIRRARDNFALVPSALWLIRIYRVRRIRCATGHKPATTTSERCSLNAAAAPLFDGSWAVWLLRCITVVDCGGVSDVDEDIGTVAVHWSPEACIADTHASDGGLSKIMSAVTSVRIISSPARSLAAGLVLYCLHTLFSLYKCNWNLMTNRNKNLFYYNAEFE